MTIENELQGIDRKINQAWRKHLRFSGAIPQTEEERQSWPKKIQSLMKEIDALEAKRLELSDELTVSIGV